MNPSVGFAYRGPAAALDDDVAAAVDAVAVDVGEIAVDEVGLALASVDCAVAVGEAEDWSAGERRETTISAATIDSAISTMTVIRRVDTSVMPVIAATRPPEDVAASDPEPRGY